jgi:glycerophosphoryl diester phosphodiesterase
MKHKIICHRGVDRINENTYKSITDVITLRNHNNITFGVEFDVQITQDDHIICYHDDTLLRLHNDDKKVCDITIEDIEKYDLPYLSNVMKQLSTNKNIIVNVEIKIYEQYKVPLLCQKVVEICETYNAIDQCIFTTFDDNVIHELLKIKQNIPINIGKIIYDDYNLQDFERLKNLGIETLILSKNMITSALNNYSELLNNIDLYIYTLFCIDNKNYDYDTKLITKMKGKTIGFITDNYRETLNLIL